MSDEPPPGDKPPRSIVDITRGLKSSRPPRRVPAEKKAVEKVVERVVIPTLPISDVDLEYLRRRAETPGARAHLVLMMRRKMIPWPEIVEFLEYESESHARAAFYAAVGKLSDPRDAEVQRYTIIEGLEDQLRRSIAMASANEFVDAEGNRYPNLDRLAWHAEARRDYELLARVSGAMAAVQVQVTAETKEIEQIVRAIEAAQGREIVEADVIELEEIPPEVEP